MPGHSQLHERAVFALNRCQESQGVDFKESGPWDALQWRVIKTLLGMGNLRDGGIIVVGVSERGETWELTGISGEHLATYDVDVVVDVTNSYASPHVDLDIVTVQYSNGRTFLVIRANEFADSPLICKKNGPSSSGLLEGCVYVRPPGIARTTRVTNAAQMHDLLELAAEKRARRILEVSRRIGLVPESSVAQLFDEELEGL
jgi:predicted HTH transcriptional regulator